MKPSPWDLTSKPSCAASCSRTMVLCSPSSSIQRWSPKRSVISVELSISLNRIVTVPSGAAAQVGLVDVDRRGHGVDGILEVRGADALRLELQLQRLLDVAFHSDVLE